MDRETLLCDTLRAWRRTRFTWGVSDCLLSVGDYAGLLTGADPSGTWRGRYHDEGGALAILDAEGGAAALLGRVMTATGLFEVNDPRRGDVVCARIGHAEVGGICLGAFCAFRSPSGVTELRMSRLTILGAWRA